MLLAAWVYSAFLYLFITLFVIVVGFFYVRSENYTPFIPPSRSRFAAHRTESSSRARSRGATRTRARAGFSAWPCVMGLLHAKVTRERAALRAGERAGRDHDVVVPDGGAVGIVGKVAE